jgi:hypothetical protein
MKYAFAAVLAVLATLTVGTLSAAATHESNNELTYAPVGTLTPDATGSGIINYVKGLSGNEPDTIWVSSFHFAGLVPDTQYTVTVKGRVPAGICTFTTKATGNGSCESEFMSLPKLAVSQLHIGSETGPVVLQATRQSILAGPGEIISRGACREPVQAGSTCDAPGRG